MKDLNKLAAYRVKYRQTIKELGAEAYLMEHVKTGARAAVISCDDDNKVFCAGFRTPPENSRGIPHILEHAVLCGSGKYPSKNTFVELIKGSMNTFLNAMTFSDKTIYPVASCNDTDFKNLMSVYSDAVFNPNILKRKEIFLQEGWHYEMDSKDSALSISGVVYNEMKGAFSSSETILNNEIITSLFSCAPYSVISGGDPEYIPDLSYEELIDFYKKYYSPSNSYIYLYGNMDAAERLTWLDQHYLSKYEKIDVDSEIKSQPPFNEMKDSLIYYPIGDDEREADNTYLSYNTVVGDTVSGELSIAFNILNYVLLGAPGAELKQAILDEKISKTVRGSYNSSLKQPVFSIICGSSNQESKESFLETIRTVLARIVQNGLDKDSINAAINLYEFKYKEANFGKMPKGLVYGIKMYESWLYGDDGLFESLNFDSIFASLRKKAEKGYFENLIDKYILSSLHSSFVMAVPKKGLMEEKEKALAKRLDLYKRSLSDEEITRLIEETQQLKEYQAKSSSREELDKIPKLSIEDIETESKPLYNDIYNSDETTIIHHDIFTNGIAYLKLSFDVNNVPSELRPYLGILRQVLGGVDTQGYSYRKLSNTINMNTGGIWSYISFYADIRENDGFKAAFEINAKTMYENIDFTFEIIKEIISTSKMENTERLYEIISDIKSQMSAWIYGSGHMAAVLRSLSYNSALSYYEESISGISFYQFIEDLEKNFEKRKDHISQCLSELMKHIFRADKLTVSYTSDKEGFEGITERIKKLKLKLYTDNIKQEEFEFIPCKKNEGLKISSSVQYVAQSGNYRNEFLYTGSLKVLKVLLSYDYLWPNVRQKGGAYGCMINFDRNGNTYIVSYRDPNLFQTYDIYKDIPKFLTNIALDDKELISYIIGAIKELDMPMNPYEKGNYSFKCYMSGINDESIQRERDEILTTKKETLEELAFLINAVLNQFNICTIGNEEKIESDKFLFKEVRNVFS